MLIEEIVDREAVVVVLSSLSLTFTVLLIGEGKRHAIIVRNSNIVNVLTNEGNFI